MDNLKKKDIVVVIKITSGFFNKDVKKRKTNDHSQCY